MGPHRPDLDALPTAESVVGVAYSLICFLAYVLWKTLARLCDKAGLGDEPRRVLEELSRIQLVDVILPTKSGIELKRSCVAVPTPHQRILLDQLGMKLHLQWSKQNVFSKNARL